jgi:hypothetical protein
MTKKEIFSKKKRLPKIKDKPDNVSDQLPVKMQTKQIVAGHKLTAKEVAIFNHFHTSHSGKATCEHFGFSPSYLTKLKKTAWWKEMELDTILLWQSQFQNKFMSHEKELFDAYIRMLKGEETFPPGWTNSVAKSMELYLKSSPLGIRATLVPRADVNIEVKEEISFNINISPEKVKGLTPEQISDWVNTGVLPSIMTEIEGDFEDITEVENELQSEDFDGSANGKAKAD